MGQLLHPTGCVLPSSEEGQELKGGTEVEAMRGAAYWLASYGLLSLLFLYHPGVPPPTVDWTLPLLNHLSRKAPQAYLQAI